MIILLSVISLIIAYVLDLILGDPAFLPHPVVLIGKLISYLEGLVRAVFPKTAKGEKLAGFLLWLIVCIVSYTVPAILLALCARVSYWLYLALDSIICWQCLAMKSLKTESMKVRDALKGGDTEGARKAVSMIVGRDTSVLDESGIARAAVETVAENTSDGVVAPMLFAAFGGAPLAMLYKAVNTMDSMLGYTDEPYTNIGFVPAKADDIFNFFPARVTACLMILAGAVLRLDVRNGIYIFQRDRKKSASPNSGLPESVCAGLLGLRLLGDAVYHGVLHKKEYIGDALREIEAEDIARANRIMYVTAFLSLILSIVLRLWFNHVI